MSPAARGARCRHSFTPQSGLVGETPGVISDTLHVDAYVLDIVLVVVQSDDAGDTREDTHQRQVSGVVVVHHLHHHSSRPHVVSIRESRAVESDGDVCSVEGSGLADRTLHEAAVGVREDLHIVAGEQRLQRL
eukprot:CAMPEP_0201100618 /NCGR_PEP_ID=MMETSP0812-20130820/9458_1 /ASSEMBLY_ACC=CAM_ASM_000668 /TAXON_ID=98059 /ORGANISM="Dinobryon sp., Strain UTEXLB2267" /LENGTH=132 /DNA_ID=CAMNT_0047357017 /DNA_START=67 /DNA_END=465 /DNA_ORIENTATION=-